MNPSKFVASTLALLLGASGLALANEQPAQTSAAAEQSSSRDQGQQQAGGSAGAAPLGAEQIMELQRALTARHLYQGDVDGLWGPKTQQALLNFQVQNDLSATGQLTPEAASALGVASGASAAQASNGPQQAQPSERQNVSGRDDASSTSASQPGANAQKSSAQGQSPSPSNQRMQSQQSSPQKQHSNQQNSGGSSDDPAFARGVDGSPSTRIRLDALSMGQMRELQQRLQLLGYYRGSVDGKSGDSTRSALQQYFRHQADLAQQGMISSSAIGTFGTNVSELQPVSGRDDTESSESTKGASKNQGSQSQGSQSQSGSTHHGKDNQGNGSQSKDSQGNGSQGNGSQGNGSQGNGSSDRSEAPKQ